MPVEFDRDTDDVLENALDSGRLPRNDALKQVVLEAVVADLEPGATYDKTRIDETVAEFFEDYVTVRRELVNFGYLSHDHLEGTYEVRKLKLTEEDYRDNTRLERHAKDLGILE